MNYKFSVVKLPCECGLTSKLNILPIFCEVAKRGMAMSNCKHLQHFIYKCTVYFYKFAILYTCTMCEAMLTNHVDNYI